MLTLGVGKARKTLGMSGRDWIPYHHGRVTFSSRSSLCAERNNRNGPWSKVQRRMLVTTKKKKKKMGAQTDEAEYDTSPISRQVLGDEGIVTQCASAQVARPW